MSLSAIIFDFDGVIADTEKLHLRAFQETLATRGIEMTARQYYARYLGLDDAGVLRALARHVGLAPEDERVPEMLADKISRYHALIAGGATLFDGVDERVRAWSRELPLAIASGARRVEIEEILQGAGLRSCFTAVVSAEDVARGKPAPDPYVAALDGLRANLANVEIVPRNIVAIEDSVPGIESARLAGMRTVGVTTNHRAEDLSSADLVVASVGALDLRTLEKLTV